MLPRPTFVFALGVLSLLSLTAASPRQSQASAKISSCRYASGQTVHYVISPEARRLIIIRNRSGLNEISEVKHFHGRTEIETNGGVGKQIQIESLWEFLRRFRMRAVSQKNLTRQLKLQPTRLCPGAFPFSPE
jgi:hypothetical protein